MRLGEQVLLVGGWVVAPNPEPAASQFASVRLIRRLQCWAGVAKPSFERAGGASRVRMCEKHQGCFIPC